MNILITGTTNGIGETIAFSLYQKGNNIITINRNLTQNQEWATNYRCDLSNLNGIEKLNRFIVDHKVDVLINNAASGRPQKFECFSQDEIEYEFNLNLFSAIHLIKMVLPNMTFNNFGRIINISSISGVTPTPFLSVYSATKSALNSFTQSIAQENSGKNISINALCLGGINTKMSTNGRKKISKLTGFSKDLYEKKMKERIGIDELIDPDTVCELIEFLISRKDASINGQLINLCGLLEIH